MEADSNSKRLTGLIPLAFGEGSLDADGTGERLAWIGESQHEAVTLTLHLVSAVAGGLLPEDPIVRSQNLEPTLVPEALREDGGALDVTEQNGHRAV
jgi:hypothetical protein